MGQPLQRHIQGRKMAYTLGSKAQTKSKVHIYIREGMNKLDFAYRKLQLRLG
jgi:hypothetical protein